MVVFIGDWVARIPMSALGLGIISYTGVATALATAIGYAQSTYTGMSGYIAAFAGLAGIGEALGMIAGAMVFRVTVAYMSKIGITPK